MCSSDLTEQPATPVSLRGDPALGEKLSQVVWLMMCAASHKHLFITDLEWLVVPALLNRQYRIFRKNDVPVAYASWAMLTDETAARLKERGGRLKPNEWTEGKTATLIDLVAPFGGADEVLKELREQVFKGRELVVVGEQQK